MGMKYRSNHFFATGQGGPVVRAEGLNEDGVQIFNYPSFPKEESETAYMFRQSIGHFADNPLKRNIVLSSAINRKNFLGNDIFGNSWYARIVGKDQYWVAVRCGIVLDCGCNNPPLLTNVPFGRKSTKIADKVFCLFGKIYSGLEKIYFSHQSALDQLRNYLSMANPYIWEGEVSGDPAIYAEFAEFIRKTNTDGLALIDIAKLYFDSLGDNFELLKRFLISIDISELNAAFNVAQ